MLLPGEYKRECGCKREATVECDGTITGWVTTTCDKHKEEREEREASKASDKSRMCD